MAMLDEEPQAKKVMKAITPKEHSLIMSTSVKHSFVYVVFQARKGSDDKQDSPALPKKSKTDVPTKTNSRGSTSEDVVGPSPRRDPAPAKTSSKLAILKKKTDDRGATSRTNLSPTKQKVSPKKEPLAVSSSDKKLTSKMETSPTALKTSPKKPVVRRSDGILSCMSVLSQCVRVVVDFMSYCFPF